MRYKKKDFIRLPDSEKLELVKTELNKEIHIGTTKRDLLMLLDWLYYKTHIVSGLDIGLPHEPCLSCHRAFWIDCDGYWTYGCEMDYCIADDE